MNQERIKPSGADRNLFRFKDKAPPPPPAVHCRPAPPVTPSGPAAAPAPPPIALKFIGVVVTTEKSQTYAVSGTIEASTMAVKGISSKADIGF